MEPGGTTTDTPLTGEELVLGHRLQEARKKAGLTQQELCQKAGLSYSTLAKIERGAIKAPSIFTISQIAKVLNSSLDALVGQSTGAALPAQKKRSKSGVRFVYFDINGCLVRFFHRAFTRLAQQTGEPADVIETTFWHYNDAVCRGEMSMDEFNQKLSDQLHVPKLNWLDYYLESIDTIPDMQQLVTWASQNYQVGLLSNIMPGFIDAMMERKILPNISYSAIIDSSKVGTIKPEPKIYEIAQQAAGLPATEILLVDDYRTNLMAAEKMGWHVLWFDDYRPDESADRIREALEPAE